MNDKSAKIEMVTLKELCTELKVDPREAREKLRLAVRDAKKNPELAKLHKPGRTWEWPKNSPALKEARTALIGGLIAAPPCPLWAKADLRAPIDFVCFVPEADNNEGRKHRPALSGHGYLSRRGPVGGVPSLIERRRQSSCFFDRFSDLLGNRVMEHVPNARNHPQVTVRNLRVKPARLLNIDYTILGARHDNNRHFQFLIAVPHRDGTWDHSDAVLTLRADLPGS